MGATTKKATKANPIDAFAAFLRACDMRVTSERLAVIEVITKHAGLFSVAELHRRMEQESLPVSLATLYNTIELLTDAGLVECLKLPDRDQALYRMASADGSHVYLVCEMCGAIKEVNDKALRRLISSQDFAAFAPRAFTLTVNGLCRKCQKGR